VGNLEIAARFSEIADLLELRDENPFRVRAYRRGAQQLEALGEEAGQARTPAPSPISRSCVARCRPASAS
jgi:DNA polymerase/3'-5' exonuclease PolX